MSGLWHVELRSKGRHLRIVILRAKPPSFLFFCQLFLHNKLPKQREKMALKNEAFLSLERNKRKFQLAAIKVLAI